MNSPIRFRTPLLFLLGAVLLSGPSAAQDQVNVRLDLAQQFYYEGSPLPLRVTVVNPQQKKISNPIKSPLFGGFKVRGGEKTLKPTGTAGAEEPQRPAKLAPGSFYGAVVDMAELYPELASEGTYRIFWNADGVKSDMLEVTVIPRYDPNGQYVAEVETDRGTIVFELFGESAPIAVKSFVDMARARFYEGLQFHEVRADQYIMGGNARFGGSGRPSIQFPAELSSMPLVAGTVVLKPARAAPPSNDSTFVILLQPQPGWSGQVTPLGQVVSGLEVAQLLSRVPSSGAGARPSFKPLEELTIKRVTIREKPPSPPQG